MSATATTVRFASFLGAALGASVASRASLSLAAESPVLATHASEHRAGGLQVSWRAAPACGDARDVAERVSTLLDGPEAGRLSARARFELTASEVGYRVTLQFSDGARQGRRGFEVESCEAALDAATLVLAVALEPNLRWEAALARLAELRRDAATTPAPRSSGALPDVTPADAARAPEPTPDPRVTTPAPATPSAPRTDRAPLPPPPRPLPPPGHAPPRLHAAAGALVDAATLPSWSTGLFAGAGAVSRPLSVDVEAFSLLPRAATLPRAASLGASVRLVGAALRVCTAPARSRLTLSPCAGAVLGAVTAEAFGLPRRRRSGTYLATTLGGQVLLRADRSLSVVGGLGAALPIRSIALTVDGVDEDLHRTSATVQSRLGLEWSF